MTTESVKEKRSFTFDKRNINEEERTVELSFSSENPYERWDGLEVLSHEPGAIVMDRLKSGAALLLNHDQDKQIGKVVKSWLDATDRKGKAIVKFSKVGLGAEIFEDVKDGIRELVSVQYIQHKKEFSEEKGKVDTYTVTSWEPLEISIVSIPADPEVGVGRDFDKSEQTQKRTESKIMEDNTATQEPEKRDNTQDGLVISEDQRRSIVVEATEKAFEKIGDEFKKQGDSTERQFAELRKSLEAKTKQPAAINVGPGSEDKELRKYNLGNVIKARMENRPIDGIEKEVSDTLRSQNKFGYSNDPNAIILPFSQRGFAQKQERVFTTATGSTPYGGYAQDQLVQPIMDKPDTMGFLDRLGVTVMQGLQGKVTFPTEATKATATYNTENATMSGHGDGALGKTTMEPHIAAAQIKISRAQDLTAVNDFNAWNQSRLERAIMKLVQQSMLNGSNGSGQPQGLDSLSGVNESGTTNTNGVDQTLDELVALPKLVSADDIDVDRCKFLTSSAAFWYGTTVEMATNHPKYLAEHSNGAHTIIGMPAVVSNMVESGITRGTEANTSHIFFGDWFYSILGIFGNGMEIIVDPYTEASKQNVVITGNIHYDVAFPIADAFSRLLYAHTE